MSVLPAALVVVESFCRKEADAAATPRDAHVAEIIINLPPPPCPGRGYLADVAVWLPRFAALTCERFAVDSPELDGSDDEDEDDEEWPSAGIGTGNEPLPLPTWDERRPIMAQICHRFTRKWTRKPLLALYKTALGVSVRSVVRQKATRAIDDECCAQWAQDVASSVAALLAAAARVALAAPTVVPTVLLVESKAAPVAQTRISARSAALLRVAGATIDGPLSTALRVRLFYVLPLHFVRILLTI